MTAITDTLRRRVYEQLREKLLSGDLPPGSRVSELKTAKDLGISRGPVREAVSQLASEGLVEQVAGFGAFVKVPDAREMADLYDFRDALESSAAALAAPRITHQHIVRLETCQVETQSILRQIYDAGQRDLDDASAAQWLKIDSRFHGTILSASNNPWLARHVTDIHFLRRIWCQRLDPNEVDVRSLLVRSYHDHGRILRALKAGNADDARRWMSSHIQSVKRNYVAQIERHGLVNRQWPHGWDRYATLATDSSPAPAPKPRRRKRGQAGGGVEGSDRQ